MEGERDVRLGQDHAIYAAMVEAMDLAVGKVRAKIDELGLREKTIVIITSDNAALFSASGPATRSFNGLHPESNFPAIITFK